MLDCILITDASSVFFMSDRDVLSRQDTNSAFARQKGVQI